MQKLKPGPLPRSQPKAAHTQREPARAAPAWSAHQECPPTAAPPPPTPPSQRGAHLAMPCARIRKVALAPTRIHGTLCGAVSQGIGRLVRPAPGVQVKVNNITGSIAQRCHARAAYLGSSAAATSEAETSAATALREADFSFLAFLASFLASFLALASASWAAASTW